MSSANKKHMQGGMNTTYSNVNTEDERNKKAEELLFQAWETAGYHGQPDEIIILEQPRKQGIWKIC